MTPPAGHPDRRVEVTGWSLHVPGLPAGALAASASGCGTPDEECCPPETAYRLLGRKGLLGKDAATRLALCAVHRALELDPGLRPGGDPDPATAVVASSNLGNVGTVVDVVRAVRRGGYREVSPLAAPSASSNVVASAVAIWFRCGGPGLMVCSGPASGLDAVRLALLLLRAGRADRVAVVGTEPADPVAVALHAAGGAGPALRAGAACVVLRVAGDEPAGPLLFGGPCPEEPPGLGSAPAGTVGPETLVRLVGGDLYGAAGVAQVAVAASRAARGEVVRVTRGVAAEGAGPDGGRALLVRPA